MRTGLAISAVGHAAVLGWAIVTFPTAPPAIPALDAPLVEVDLVASTSQLTAGAKNAPKAEQPKPLVEKIAEPKPAENPAQKVAEKPEIVTASAPPPAPVPESKPVEAKPPEAEKKPDPKPDPIAEALKRDDAKKPEKKEVAKVPVPPKKPPQPKFDPKQIEQRLALIDKRDPQRRVATGDTLNPLATLGASTGNAPRLSQSEIDALRARLRDCWNLPAGAADSKDLNVEVRILLKQDGSLSAEPTVLNRSTNPFFQVAAESALRAVRTCAPFDFLPLAKYEAWKDIEVNFDPQYMFRS
jgi:outer membrane biosynthesis protein TonB